MVVSSLDDSYLLLCRVVCCQTLSLLSTPACGELLQQLSCFIVAALRLCQTEECSAANEQIAHALHSILSRLSTPTPPSHAATVSSSTPTYTAHSAGVSEAAEWGESMDMLLCCQQLHQTEQLSTPHWLAARQLLSVKDVRVLALWQRWKVRLARSVRGESEQYRLAGEDENVVGAVEEEEVDVNLGRFATELQALLTEIAEEEEECS